MTSYEVEKIEPGAIVQVAIQGDLTLGTFVSFGRKYAIIEMTHKNKHANWKIPINLIQQVISNPEKQEFSPNIPNGTIVVIKWRRKHKFMKFVGMREDGRFSCVDASGEKFRIRPESFVRIER